VKVELHMIQNFAPSCLNRDDVNAPKECQFGGVRRARISSQCIKRSIRTYWSERGLLAGNRAVRTRRLIEEVARRLEAKGKDIDSSRGLVELALTTAGVGARQGATEYLLFVSERAVSGLVEAIREHWDDLAGALAEVSGAGEGQTARRKKGESAGLPDQVRRAVAAIFDTFKAADIALFGRMVADAPERNVDAACQVAHAISTHRVSAEIDFYSAVDDLQPKEETGAGMLGTVEFNSACFYRYALVDMGQLCWNLEGDGDLAVDVLKAFVEGSVKAIPSGKQNSMAAHNPPSLVMAVVRPTGAPWSLANAFEDPVRPAHSGGGLVAQSIRRLDEYWGKLKRVYGEDGIAKSVYLLVDDVDVKNLGDKVETLQNLIEQVVVAVKGDSRWASC